MERYWVDTEVYRCKKGTQALSGARHAADLSDMDDPTAESSMITGLEQVYKRASQKIKNFRFMNWPKEEWARASYSFPKCGDILRCGPTFAEGFKNCLHFAGEHTCYAFTGYMEGALQSGYRLAQKLVFRDGKSW
jgi:monoamine oxidase